MKKKKWIFLSAMLFIIVIVVFVRCSTERGDQGEKEVMSQAESMVSNVVVSEFKRMGIEIEDHEVISLNPAASIHYSKGGTFEFYEIGYRLLPKDLRQVKRAIDRYNVQLRVDDEGWLIQDPENSISGKTRAFISAYKDGKDFYEFNLYYGPEYRDFVKEGNYNRKAFKNKVKYLYEDVEPALVEAEYTLKFGDKSMSIGQNFKGELGLKDAQIKKEKSGDLLGVITRYKENWTTDDFRGETYCYFQKKNEPLLRMATTSQKARTPRGIGIGSTQDELFGAYGAENLVYSSKSFGGESLNSYAEKEGIIGENEDWTCFGFTGDDKTNYYMAFYMKDKKVSVIEMGTGFDYKPFQKVQEKYNLEAENLIDDHIDQENVMKYDVRLPKIKDSVSANEGINAQIQADFEQIIGFSESGYYQPSTDGFAYPWVQINYSISNLGTVEALNVFSTYSSALGSGSDGYVHSYYYDTTCGARMSEEAAIYRLGYSKELLESYFQFEHGYVLDTIGEQEGMFENLIFYFDVTGEPMYIINGFS